MISLIIQGVMALVVCVAVWQLKRAWVKAAEAIVKSNNAQKEAWDRSGYDDDDGEQWKRMK